MRRRIVLAAGVLVALVGCDKKSADLRCPAPVSTKFDSDGDLLTDVQEAALGTDAHAKDSDHDGFSDYAEVQAGTDPMASSSKPSGAVSSVVQITDAAQLIGGPAAQGRVGDWLLENDRVRAIVQNAGIEQQQIGSFGGNLVDADIQRGGAPGNDNVGMIIPVMQFSATSHPDRVVVVSDGSDGGPAILRTCGPGDTYQTLDFSATLIEFGVNPPFDSNAVFPIEFSNDYVLAPGSSTIEIITTIANRGKKLRVPVGDVIETGGALEIWSSSQRGFGSASISAITHPSAPTHFLGYLSKDSAWGYVGDADPTTAFTIEGVTILQDEFDSPLEILSANPPSGMHEIGKGSRFSWHRGVTVTDGQGGVEPFARVWADRHSPAARAHTGTVLDDAGMPVAGARVIALADTAGQFNLVSADATESDAAGNYTLTLPPGNWLIAADVIGRPFPTFSGAGVTTQSIQTPESGNTIDVAAVTFSASEAAPDITFTKAGHLNVTVSETLTGNPLPARLIVVGSDPSPRDTIFRDLSEETTSVVVSNQTSKDGTFTFDIEPGSYEVYATHGMEFSISSAATLAIAGSAEAISLSLGRVIDTTGWISADFHVHMLNSPDSPVPLADRAISGAAEGLDVIVPTDHDYITDLNPTIASLSLSSNLASVPGEEITTWTMGHFNAWPLTRDDSKASGGSYKWSGDGGGHPITNKPLKKIFEDVDAMFAGTQVKEVNHPRSGGSGSILNQYFSAIQLDTDTLKTTGDPAFFRVPPQEGATADDTKLFYDGFDAQEVVNGFDSVNTRNANLNDLLTFLSHGMTVAGMGNSDTHHVFANQVGYPRNFVALGDDAPLHLGSNVEAFAKGVTDGHTFLTQGPFLRVTVHGQTDGAAGDLIAPASGQVTLDAIVEWPAWVGVDTLHIHMNSPDTITPPDVDGNITHPVTIPGGDIDLRPLATLMTAGNGLPFYRATIPTVAITTPSSGDAWIVLDVLGDLPGTKSLFPIIPRGTSNANGERAYALYNAIFIDGNGNGVYDAPGITISAAYRRPDPRVIKHWDGKGDMPADIREQWETLAKHSCLSD